MADAKNLPTLSELHHDIAEAFKNDKFKLLMNQPPHETWIKKHPLAKVKNDEGKNVPARYLPIDKVELLLDRIFQMWRIEVLREYTMFNSIGVTVRVHYLHPVTGTWEFHDGVGAKSVQTDAGATAADLGAIKDAAVQMALPSAKSYAIKDACDHLGKLFGKDLNRANTKNFIGSYTQSEDVTPTPTPTPTPPVNDEYSNLEL